VLVALKRLDDKGARQIGAEDGEEEEFAVGINICAFGEIIAQMAFGQKIGEESGNTAPDRTEIGHESARAAFERET